MKNVLFVIQKSYIQNRNGKVEKRVQKFVDQI